MLVSSTINRTFITKRESVKNADSLPVVVVKRNSITTSIIVSVTNVWTWEYSLSFTIPANWESWDIVDILITAIVDGVSTTSLCYLWKITETSELDLTGETVRQIVDEALIDYDWATKSELDDAEVRIIDAMPEPIKNSELEIHSWLDSYSNKWDWKATSVTATIDYTAIATSVWNATNRELTDKTGFSLEVSQIQDIALAVESAIINDTDGTAVVQAIVDAIGNENITASSIASQVRTELATELARIDETISGTKDVNIISVQGTSVSGVDDFKASEFSAMDFWNTLTSNTFSTGSLWELLVTNINTSLDTLASQVSLDTVQSLVSDVIVSQGTNTTSLDTIERILLAEAIIDENNYTLTLQDSQGTIKVWDLKDSTWAASVGEIFERLNQ